MRGVQSGRLGLHRRTESSKLFESEGKEHRAPRKVTSGPASDFLPLMGDT